MSRTTYADLYAVIGTNFGAGDGSTTFNLPDLQGISLTGVGTQSISGRSKSGPALGAVREDQVQGHRHDLNYNNGAGSGTGPTQSTTSNGAGASNDAILVIRDPVTDRTNGTPRTGAYTHGPEIGVNFIIKP